MNDNILRPSDHPFTHEDDDDGVVASARRLLDSEERLDILFVHLDDVDAAGHAFDYGPTVPEYVEALKKTDESEKQKDTRDDDCALRFCI